MQIKFLILSALTILSISVPSHVNATGVLEGHECMEQPTKEDGCQKFKHPIAQRHCREDNVGKSCIAGCSAYGNSAECEDQLGMFSRYNKWK